MNEVGRIVERCLALHEDLDFNAVKQWKAANPGRKVIGYMPVYVPRELIHAAGMLPVGILGGGDGLENGEQVHCGGHEIEHRIDQRRQDRHRTGIEAGGELYRDQQRRHGERGIGGALHQRRRPPDVDGGPVQLAAAALVHGSMLMDRATARSSRRRRG